MAHGHSHGHDEECNHHHHNEAQDEHRYSLSGWVGLVGSLAEGAAGFKASSHGAISDALHALSDAFSFFISARFARKRDMGAWSKEKTEKLGVVFHTLFLAFAVVLIAWNIWYGKRMFVFSGGWMFAASCVGVLFNAAQMFIVGHSRDQGMNMHEAVRQHAFYDLLYSCVVMHASFIIFILDTDLSLVMRAVLAMIVTAVFAIAFPTLRFVKLRYFRAKLLYIAASIGTGILSAGLACFGWEELVDLLASVFLGGAMLVSVVRNCIALGMWNRGGHRLVHRH